MNTSLFLFLTLFDHKALKRCDTLADIARAKIVMEFIIISKILMLAKNFDLSP